MAEVFARTRGFGTVVSGVGVVLILLRLPPRVGKPLSSNSFLINGRCAIEIAPHVVARVSVRVATRRIDTCRQMGLAGTPSMLF